MFHHADGNNADAKQYLKLAEANPPPAFVSQVTGKKFESQALAAKLLEQAIELEEKKQLHHTGEHTTMKYLYRDADYLQSVASLAEGDENMEFLTKPVNRRKAKVEVKYARLQSSSMDV